MNEYVKLENVGKIIKGHILLSDVNMTITRGKSVGLIGHNGSGKTLLLKVICGLYSASEGTVIINGKRIGKDVDFPDDMGIVIETPGFITGRSGYENLKLLAGIKHKASVEDIRQCMKFVGLDPNSRKKVGTYSLGMKQRLGLAQAIMEDPQLLILDEPFNGLDKNGIEDMRNLLLELKKQGKTMIIASHVEEDIKLLCDEVYHMEAGRIIEKRETAKTKTKSTQ